MLTSFVGFPFPIVSLFIRSVCAPRCVTDLGVYQRMRGRDSPDPQPSCPLRPNVTFFEVANELFKYSRSNFTVELANDASTGGGGRYVSHDVFRFLQYMSLY